MTAFATKARCFHRRSTAQLLDRALKCSTFFGFEGLGRIASRWPFQRAGFTPFRYPLTVARLSMYSMRCLSFVAVSVLVVQIGSSMVKISLRSTSETDILPISGKAYRSTNDIQSCTCLLFLNSIIFFSWHNLAASSKVIEHFADNSRLRFSLLAMGSSPSEI